MSVRLTLIAHAATAATRAASFPADEPIMPREYEKIPDLKTRIGRVDAAFTSPSLRARQTAEALELGASIDPAIRDVDVGDWAGRELAEVAASDPFALAQWMENPASASQGGESVAGLLNRVENWLETIRNGRGRVAAVTHAAVIRAVTVLALDANPRSFWKIDIEPLSFSGLQAHAGGWKLRYLNVAHSTRKP